MFVNASEESLAWEPESVKSKLKVKDWGPDDFVLEFIIDIPWALKYMMSIPDILTTRVVLKKDFPTPGSHNYLLIPYDMEKGQCVETMGGMKIKSGCISPHPTDPNKCILVSCDSFSLGMMPDFAVKAMLKTKAIGPIQEKIAKFKKSQICA